MPSIVEKITALVIPVKKERETQREASPGLKPYTARLEKALKVGTNPEADFDLQLRLYLQNVAQAVDTLIEDLVQSFLIGSVTLAVAPATTTTITNAKITANHKIFLLAATANAAATTGLYATCGAGSATINHNAAAAADRTFHYLILL